MTIVFHTPRTSAHAVNDSSQANVPFSELDTAIKALTMRIQVVDNSLTEPPGVVIDGDIYIPATGSIGDWTGHDGKLVFTNNAGTSWIAVSPVKGLIIHSIIEGFFRRWDGTSWILANRYIMGGGFEDIPGGGAVIHRHRPVVALRFPTDLTGTGSNFYGDDSAIAETIFSLRKNDVEFGTVTIPISGTEGVFSVTQTDFTITDRFTIVNQTVNDLGFGDIGFAIAALRL